MCYQNKNVVQIVRHVSPQSSADCFAWCVSHEKIPACNAHSYNKVFVETV